MGVLDRVEQVVVWKEYTLYATAILCVCLVSGFAVKVFETDLGR